MKSVNKKSAGGKPLCTRLGLIVALTVLVLIAVAPMAAGQPTPFLINGWVNCTDGDPVNGPIVTVTNLNTSEVFIAETNASSNYYQVITSSLNVSAGNVLRFNASNSDGNSTEFDHTVTEAEMDAGGFEQNAAIDCGGPAGICGDVTGDGYIRVSDGIRIIANQTFVGDPQYFVDPWAADVNCDGFVRVSDGIRIIANQTFVGDSRYFMDCC